MATPPAATMALAPRMRSSYKLPGVRAAICRRNLAGAGALRGRRSMRGRVCRRSVGLVAGLGLVLGACAHNAPSTDAAAADSELNSPPTDYKREILGAMHAYLNDPTGIRDAGIAEPALKTIGNSTRYVVCVRFNAQEARRRLYRRQGHRRRLHGRPLRSFRRQGAGAMRRRDLCAVPGAAEAVALRLAWRRWWRSD